MPRYLNLTYVIRIVLLFYLQSFIAITLCIEAFTFHVQASGHRVGVKYSGVQKAIYTESHTVES